MRVSSLARAKLPPRVSVAAFDPGRKRGRRRGLLVGLLGGSFNPAHEGHRHISLLALKRLRLDAVWWLVSPQNPLKPVAGMAPIAARLEGARTVARHPRIKVTDIEGRLGTTYTAETLKRLRQRLPQVRFVWLMGADNLAQIHKWKDWQRIFHTVPVAVLARPSYCLKALASDAAHRFVRNRVPESASGQLGLRRLPAWTFLVGPLSPLSATAIRAQRRSPRSGRAGLAKDAIGRDATTRG